MDQTDYLILQELERNSRITMKELGQKVHLTGQAATARVQKLEDQGMIEKYTVRKSYEKLGFPVHAFIQVFTQSPDHTKYLAFIEKQSTSIVQHVKTTGEACYLLETRFTSHDDLNTFLENLSSYAQYKTATVIKSFT
ncbi:Lrp/AsnC family transcriptional regulator [Jeotgalibacillus aurantiacus]|uniref:Lrp/AsnC family transcriptional regulator n=1 Tax=Jeotgalibacillus aurantiacus TaxID=2763266 RepID=UPI001D0B5812|nr:winged helix-turn-helix transcriptional regulator [Jeotgalibacillus aurantiacus]